MPATSSLTPMLILASDKLYNGIAALCCLVVVFTLCRGVPRASNVVAGQPDALEVGTAPKLNTVDTSDPRLSHHIPLELPNPRETRVLIAASLIAASYICFIEDKLEVNLLVVIVFVVVAKCSLSLCDDTTAASVSELPTAAVAPSKVSEMEEKNVQKEQFFIVSSRWLFVFTRPS
ncbi:hypothetical protein FB45DRAFT_1038872 [Roridomyces roridus]|uniref:Uncharacterized protein n=1 Tax=Roridomyces roridus TaxID=1738132 RepID=A0AAD7B369_9AGAR|nr:hypothetical protein FB45DRAFT_1038872 [Roridomyces roridus]